MWKKIVGYFALGAFLIWIGLYIEGSISLVNKHADIFDKYPTVFVGVGAAFVALLGVIISQIWQTANMNQNIKANEDNLEKQLEKQQEILQKQFSEQRDLLTKQNDHAVKLESKKLEAARRENRYEEFEENRKNLWLSLLKLQRLSKLRFECTEKLVNNVIRYRIHTYLSEDDNESRLGDMYQEFLEEQDKQRSYNEEIEDLIHNIDYLHNVKKIGDKDAYLRFFKAHYTLSSLENKSYLSVKTEQEFYSDVSNKGLSFEELREKHTKESEAMIKRFNDFIHSNENGETVGYAYAYKAFLLSLKDSKHI